jgi:hypothetical protein
MLAEDEARRRLVREARAWVGTPYHPGADLRGVGVDCGMLLVRVFVDAGLGPAFDPRPYPQDWHLQRRAGHFRSRSRDARAAPSRRLLIAVSERFPTGMIRPQKRDVVSNRAE